MMKNRRHFGACLLFLLYNKTKALTMPLKGELHHMKTFIEKLKDPRWAAIFAGLIGLLLGLLWAWVIQPVEFVDATPDYLRADLREDYLRMAIDSFAVNGNADLALRRWDALGPVAYQHLKDIQMNPGFNQPDQVMAFSQLIEANRPEGAVPVPEPSGGPSPLLLLGLLVGIVAIIAGVYYALRLFRPSIGKNVTQTAAQAARRMSETVEVVDYESAGMEPPMAQFITSYVLGDNLYDESFSIEAPDGEFLGECGMGISETIGVGLQDKHVSAFEIWLFDKNDIQTVTKVLMSEHLFNDPEAVQRLSEKGEPVLAKPRQQVTLETATLRIIATVSDMAYGSGALPENSFFDHISVELAVWRKPKSETGGGMDFSAMA